MDRSGQLKEGQEVTLDGRGLSRFGACYWDAIQSKPFDAMTEAEQRESMLEAIKKEPMFQLYVSRMQAFFGANTIEEARRFAERIEPKPTAKVPIVEVFASKFWTLDMNWLDYAVDHAKRAKNLREYWYAAITNHNPETGKRNPPNLEVLMALPVTIGKVVDWV